MAGRPTALKAADEVVGAAAAAAAAAALAAASLPSSRVQRKRPSVTMTKLTNLAVIEPMADGRPMPREI